MTSSTIEASKSHLKNRFLVIWDYFKIPYTITNSNNITNAKCMTYDKDNENYVSNEKFIREIMSVLIENEHCPNYNYEYGYVHFKLIEHRLSKKS